MSISKSLLFIFLIFLSLFQVGLFLLFNLLIIIWKPKTRIIEFFNIIRRKPLSRDGKPPPARWNDPSLGEHNFVHLKGIKLHYVANGDEDKPLMIFLHGFVQCWYTWRYQIREFSKNYRVVAIDRRGYSLSDCPVGKANYTLEKQATDIAEVIEALGYKDCILVGYDIGAAVAFRTASLFPDKISKLIVFNIAVAPAWFDHVCEELSDVKFFWPLLYAQVPYSPEYMLVFDDFKSFDSILRAANGIRKENLTEEDLEVYKYALSQKGVIYAVLEGYRTLLAASNMFRQCRDVFDSNTLIIHGTEDVWIKKKMIDKSKVYLKNGVIKTVEGGTHFVHEDQPELVNELINEYLNEGGNEK